VTGLVLSLFPGIGLLDQPFEEAGFCVVRGPDLLWGGDVRRFHPPAGRFDGVIGGPPCQRFSRLANVVRAVHGEDSLALNLIPEYERVVGEAQPTWFIMENVEGAPLPVMDGYQVHAQVLNNRDFGAEQNRRRRISFGTRDGQMLRVDGFVALHAIDFEPAVCSSAGGRRASVKMGGSGKRKRASLLINRSIEEEAVLQGLPRDFLAGAPFTADGKRQAIGNGVPLPMGRAIARAVVRALAAERAA
jgi:DNA (cytosine-5)-methyltransferase 1